MNSPDIIEILLKLDVESINDIISYNPLSNLPCIDLVKFTPKEPEMSEDVKLVRNIVDILLIAAQNNKYVDKNDIVAIVKLDGTKFNGFIVRLRNYLRTNTQYILQRIKNNKGIFFYATLFKEQDNNKPNWT